MIHSCSASYFDRMTFAKNRIAEELPVHYLSQEIAEMEGLSVVESAYDDGVELIRGFKKALKIEKTDLEFATELIRQPLIERFDYLESLINETLGLTATVEEYELIYKKLEAIKSWKES